MCSAIDPENLSGGKLKQVGLVTAFDRVDGIEHGGLNDRNDPLARRRGHPGEGAGAVNAIATSTLRRLADSIGLSWESGFAECSPASMSQLLESVNEPDGSSVR